MDLRFYVMSCKLSLNLVLLFSVIESALILLQTVPTHIQVEAVQKKLLNQVNYF